MKREAAPLCIAANRNAYAIIAAVDLKATSEISALGLRLDKNTPPLERKLRYFLYDLCVDWGFCIPPDDSDRIASMQRVTAEEFAIEVVKAEGFGGSTGSEWVKKISIRFADHFGSDELSAD